MNNTMKPSEVLKAARQLITPIEKWTQGAFMRDAEDNVVLSWGVDRETACKFCGIGAITIAMDAGDAHTGGDSKEAIYLDEACGQFFPNYNDSHSHEEVLAAFDKAIALTESEGELNDTGQLHSIKASRATSRAMVCQCLL